MNGSSQITWRIPPRRKRFELEPDETLYAQQWRLAQIEAPVAWEVQTGAETVVIAIVDSGIDRTHPDLQGQLWVNPEEIQGNGLVDDNNGLVDDYHGWDFVSEDNDAADDNGHGTQVAGGSDTCAVNLVDVYLLALTQVEELWDLFGRGAR